MTQALDFMENEWFQPINPSNTGAKCTREPNSVIAMSYDIMLADTALTEISRIPLRYVYGYLWLLIFMDKISSKIAEDNPYLAAFQ